MPMPKQRPHRSKQDYATPPEFIRAACDLLCIDAFAFDFAADKRNAKAPRFWTQKDDSLSKTPAEWRAAVGDGWGWLNPPYTKIEDWARKCAELQDDGGRVAFLVPASVGANWYRDYVDPYAEVLALNGRICFDPSRPTWGYPKDCILALYSPEKAPSFDVWPWKA